MEAVNKLGFDREVWVWPMGSFSIVEKRDCSYRMIASGHDRRLHEYAFPVLRFRFNADASMIAMRLAEKGMLPGYSMRLPVVNQADRLKAFEAAANQRIDSVNAQWTDEMSANLARLAAQDDEPFNVPVMFDGGNRIQAMIR